MNPPAAYSRRRFLESTALFATASLVRAESSSKADGKKVEVSFTTAWLDVILDINADDVDRVGARPPILARQMAIPLTAMYDAWAAYDAKAKGAHTGDSLRRPVAEHTEENKRIAISYAAYRTMADLFPDDLAKLNAHMAKVGHDPANQSTDKATPQGIGNLAAAAIIAARHQDGANQLGNEVGSNGKPYSDYTFYQPVNPADKIYDPDRWQPIAFVNPKDPKGPKITPGFLAPHWYRVTPFALKSSSQFRPGPPPKVGSEQMRKEAEECILFNASLSCDQKAIVEFMRDGPRSTGQSGHWLKFARAVAVRDGHNLDKDVQCYFAVANAAMDSFIAAWEAKRVYDSSRPWTIIHHLWKDQPIKGWGGPDKGTVDMKGQDWHPYSPDTFVTPPFPGYVSGHSCVSGCCGKVLELFSGSDTFGEVELRHCGALTETIGQQVSLKLPTFTATADMAGLSRVMGGYHIQADNVEGLALGRKVASVVWDRCKALIAGTG